MADRMDFGGNAGSQLTALIKRIQNLEDEIAALNQDKREVYAEAKATGFDKKVMRTVVRRLAKARSEVEAEDDLVDMYENIVRGIRSDKEDDDSWLD